MEQTLTDRTELLPILADMSIALRRVECGPETRRMCDRFRNINDLLSCTVTYDRAPLLMTVWHALAHRALPGHPLTKRGHEMKLRDTYRATEVSLDTFSLSDATQEEKDACKDYFEDVLPRVLNLAGYGSLLNSS